MRFYRLDLTDATTGKPILPTSLGGNPITSLLPNGQVNPAALNIEFDIPVVNYTPGNQNKDAFLRIWGLGLQAIGSAVNLAPPNGHVNVTFAAGMSKGLPLANPAQQGLIMSGSIIQAWGNYIGTDQTVDFLFGPRLAGTGTQGPGATAFPFSWLAGTPLNVAIAQTLAVAFPGMKQIINISPNLVLNRSEYGVYHSMEEFTRFLKGITQPIIGGSYPGISISTNGQNVLAWDNTKPALNPIKAIAFQDMVGQPTWIGPQTISVKLVLRGDLSTSDIISLPTSSVTTQQAAFTNFQDKTAFTGNYSILEIEHYGNFRQPDAASWNTTVVAVIAPKSALPAGNVSLSLTTPDGFTISD